MNKPPNQVSQNDIARKCGLARSTVSRALVNHPSIPEGTREKVQRMAHDLGYRRNAFVSMLTTQLRLSRSARSGATLGYITSFPRPQIEGIGSVNYCHFYEGARDRAETLGFSLDCIWRTQPGMTARRFQDILIARGIRGIIIAPRPKPLAHLVLDWSRFAVVCVGHRLPKPKIDVCSASHFQLIDLALRRLRKLGYRRIGFAIFPNSDQFSARSFSARFALHQQTIRPADRLPFPGWFAGSMPPTLPMFEKWLERNRPEAVIGCGTVVLDWLKSLGLDIPRDIGFVDISLPSKESEVSGVSEMSAVIGEAAVDALADLIYTNRLGLPTHPRSILIEGEWVDGAKPTVHL
jgi:LacI family transcriptional regulator